MHDRAVAQAFMHALVLICAQTKLEITNMSHDLRCSTPSFASSFPELVRPNHFDRPLRQEGSKAVHGRRYRGEGSCSSNLQKCRTFLSG